MLGGTIVMTLNQTILWRRLDAPGHEFAQLFFEDAVWRLIGTAIFVFGHPQRLPVRLDYIIECDANWITKSARVSGWVGDETISIDIAVDSARRWLMNGLDITEVEGCVDIGFSFSPSSKLLPIRRLRLNIGDEVAETAALLRFPDFRLERMDQSYRRISATGYQYETETEQSTAQLTVNENGFVTGYPNLWVIEAQA